MIFCWSLSDNTSQVLMILLSILTNLNNAVVFKNCTVHTNYNWCHRNLYIPYFLFLKQGLGIYLSFAFF